VTAASTRVSVLVPTYNRPHFLEQALRSVLSQPVESVEVLVGDDGVDGGAVVSALGDSRLRYFRNSPRVGMAQNWNWLLGRATGDYLALLMDDDIWSPDFLPTTLHVFSQMSDLGVVFTDHLTRRGNRLTRRCCALAEGRHEEFSTTFLEHKPVAVSAALFRREAWRDARPLPPTAAADMVLFARMAEAGWPFYYVDRPLMIYRAHDAMYSASLDFRDDCVRAWEALTVTDPAARRLLDRQLADALFARAMGELRNSRYARAREDLRRAVALGPTRTGLARGALSVSYCGPVARLAQGTARRLRQRLST